MVEEALRLVDIMTPREDETMGSRSREHWIIITSKLAETFSWDSKRGNWVSDEVKGYASGLSNEQCTRAIEAFNHYEDELSLEIIEALGPILLVVLRVVVVGCYQVTEYFVHLNSERFEAMPLVKVLKELESKRKLIYLREWRVRDEE
jgi:hypothetical protein